VVLESCWITSKCCVINTANCVSFYTYLIVIYLQICTNWQQREKERYATCFVFAYRIISVPINYVIMQISKIECTYVLVTLWFIITFIIMNSHIFSWLCIENSRSNSSHIYFGVGFTSSKCLTRLHIRAIKLSLSLRERRYFQTCTRCGAV